MNWSLTLNGEKKGGNKCFFFFFWNWINYIWWLEWIKRGRREEIWTHWRHWWSWDWGGCRGKRRASRRATRRAAPARCRWGRRLRLPRPPCCRRRRTGSWDGLASCSVMSSCCCSWSWPRPLCSRYRCWRLVSPMVVVACIINYHYYWLNLFNLLTYLFVQDFLFLINFDYFNLILINFWLFFMIFSWFYSFFFINCGYYLINYLNLISIYFWLFLIICSWFYSRFFIFYYFSSF